MIEANPIDFTGAFGSQGQQVKYRSESVKANFLPALLPSSLRHTLETGNTFEAQNTFLGYFKRGSDENVLQVKVR